jgi:hypothetical protein
MNTDDTITGVLVGRSLTDGADGPTLSCRWSIDRAGHFAASAAQPWPDLDAEVFDQLQMVTDGAGQPIALLHSELGWACVRQGLRQEVAPPLGLQTSVPPAFRLGPDGMTAIVVWHDAHRGLVAAPVGVEIPDFLGEGLVQPALLPNEP